MQIHVLTLFPEIVSGPINQSILKIAQDKNLANIKIINIRDFALDKHKTCDDRPFGGGPGMVMMAEPIANAIESVRKPNSKVIFLTPQGQVFNQEKATMFSQLEHLILLCGHYEGIDERIRSEYVDIEVSIGDYILTNGAIASLVFMDACIRLIPGVLGCYDSLKEETFNENKLEYPQFTRPRNFRGSKVPEVLLSGNHEEIRIWRDHQSLARTHKVRPDLIKDMKKER